MVILSFLLALVLASTPATAETTPSERVEVGHEAPEVTLTGIDGEEYSSSALVGERPLVLIFFRGSW